MGKTIFYKMQIKIVADRYNGYGFQIYYDRDQSFKNRIDICEPTLSSKEDYYSDYYHINHSSFLVLHYNTMSLDVLLYDPEYKHIYSSGSIIQKPLFACELTENNTIQILGSADSVPKNCLFIRPDGTTCEEVVVSEGSCSDILCREFAKQLVSVPVTRLLTYGEFLQISNYKMFRLVHREEHGCDCCETQEKQFLAKLDRIAEKDYIGMYRLLEAYKSIYLYNRTIQDKIVCRLNIMVLNLYSKNYYPRQSVHGDYCNKIVNMRDYLMANI
jgi:hypothetical protein